MNRTDVKDQPEVCELVAQLERAQVEIERLTEQLESRRHIVDILHDVMGNLSSDEIFHMLVRRVGRALQLSQASVVLARPGASVGQVVVAFEKPTLDQIEVQLDRYPEILLAIEKQNPVLIPDVSSSVIYARLRELWAREGITVQVRSVIALPFALDEEQSGVFLLRRSVEQPELVSADVDFATTCVNSALMAIRRARAVEETIAANEVLDALAHLDPLTELLNRRALAARLQAEIDRIRRYDAPLALLMLDLDHFKTVNDTYGHLVGDSVLAEFGRVLQRGTRSVDIVARYGGEEFMIALPETTYDGALAFAERLRERIEAHPFRSASQLPVRLTASIGIASFPAPGVDTLEELLASADAALYRAKNKGRNRVAV
ncbi:MAG TPA: sensor domain-containing diguanylate cyclase [Gemmatimonadaceae bacterium]|nr:sensor domain-containing diguanylate cyclase [Gemmatimonadaceae bacterium]